MTRLMALDVGEARIGVAVCDAMGIIASPYTTLHVTRDENRTWAEIQRLIEESDAEGLVVGLPISMDGQIHGQGAWVQAFVARLKKHIVIPVTFWDERLSTVEAQRLLAQRDENFKGASRRRGQSKRRTQRRQRGQELDALAAAVILQDYLDSAQRNTEEHIL
ncbi:MAG TPA: Holliday junction resolvase RuvX [Ktedonobacter sp.]|nr:Holliday junction resolvase RuvX [Ktedonobacter sp.]